LSKYNHALDFNEPRLTYQPIVLVIDQTHGDRSVKYGQADESHFKQMLEAAIKENPLSLIWVKTHPDVISGKKKGYLTELSAYKNRIRLITQDFNPLSLLEAVDKVYCVTSQMGFEALFLGKKVITFGVPWFAGWGMTEDRHPNIEILQKNHRRTARNLVQLFCAAYLQYSRYINPNNGKTGSIFDVIDYLQKVKQLNQRLAGNIYCVGLSPWKRAVIAPFFRFPQCRLYFFSDIKQLKNTFLPSDAKLLVWGQGKPELIAFAEKHQLPLLRMEDGFIRSVGLGSNLVTPFSLVVDDKGIYFNAQTPSRLELIFQMTAFSDNDLNMAKNVQNHLLNENICKYNVGTSGFYLNKTNKRTILVPGQVEDDASILLGSPQIKTNLDLLKKVRELNPDAYIIYKPHPDVVSGNRIGKISPSDVLKYADDIIENANILDCIHQVDEVHTMTSLAGFEALIRNKTVHCYGLPFYSNWGLTIDHIELERRNRKLTLEELICGTLLHYPLYIDPQKQQIIHVEQAVYLLQKQKTNTTNHAIRRPWLFKQIEKIKHLYRAFV
ncbi:capsular polysaccharide biosynthesis protein, partial [Glaesserella sp.]|uniref:capsular polysaccharide biosynthesis protein n=1 Tax=Glaesserella sp. TaxID=2094731 RepID=UPI00359F4C3A